MYPEYQIIKYSIKKGLSEIYNREKSQDASTLKQSIKRSAIEATACFTIAALLYAGCSLLVESEKNNLNITHPKTTDETQQVKNSPAQALAPAWAIATPFLAPCAGLGIAAGLTGGLDTYILLKKKDEPSPPALA